MRGEIVYFILYSVPKEIRKPWKDFGSFGGVAVAVYL